MSSSQRGHATFLAVACSVIGCTAEPSILQLPGPIAEGGLATGEGCKDDRGCPTPLHCDRETGDCVACTVADHCATRLCDLASHTCSRCREQSDCAEPTPVCDVDDGHCVQCRLTSECGFDEVCQFAAHACAARCRSDADCAGTERTTCAVAAGVCVACTTSADCAAPLPFCKASEGSCVECLSDADCPDRHCSIENQCHTCYTDADCDLGQKCKAGDCS